MATPRPLDPGRTPDRGVHVLRSVAIAAVAVMTITVVVGAVTAPQGAAGALLDNVWGRVTIVDLYLALGAGWSWIAWRERDVARALLWAVLLITTGSIALWGYLALATRGAHDVTQVLRGGRDIGA